MGIGLTPTILRGQAQWLLCLDQKLHTLGLEPWDWSGWQREGFRNPILWPNLHFSTFASWLMSSLPLGMTFLPIPIIWNCIAHFVRSNYGLFSQKWAFVSLIFMALLLKVWFKYQQHQQHLVGSAEVWTPTSDLLIRICILTQFPGGLQAYQSLSCTILAQWFSHWGPGKLEGPEILEGGLRSSNYFRTNTKTAFAFSLSFTPDCTGEFSRGSMTCEDEILMTGVEMCACVFLCFNFFFFALQNNFIFTSAY